MIFITVGCFYQDANFCGRVLLKTWAKNWEFSRPTKNMGQNWEFSRPTKKWARISGIFESNTKKTLKICKCLFEDKCDRAVSVIEKCNSKSHYYKIMQFQIFRLIVRSFLKVEVYFCGLFSVHRIEFVSFEKKGPLSSLIVIFFLEWGWNLQISDFFRLLFTYIICRWRMRFFDGT